MLIQSACTAKSSPLINCTRIAYGIHMNYVLTVISPLFWELWQLSHVALFFGTFPPFKNFYTSISAVVLEIATLAQLGGK